MGHRLFEVGMTHVALARKWRPKRFEEVVGQTFAVQALTNALNKNFLHHAYLFTGTRGVGKTTIARILAKCLNCETGITATPCEQCRTCTDINNGCFPDLFEIDAASRTKVEDTRDILDNVQYAPTIGRFKIYLIDEVHMLSGHSFNALLKTLEEPPEHVKFLLATTDPQKLPATVLSRCLQFHLSHLTIDEINQQAQHILKQEKTEFESDATALISKAANGSMRDALSLLDQAIAFGNGRVMTDDTRAMLGSIDQTLILEILNALADQDANQLVETTAKLSEHGIDFSAALKELMLNLHTITLLQVAPGQVNDPVLAELANKITAENIQLYYQIGLIGQRDLAYAPTLQSGFEMTLLRMLAFTPSTLQGVIPKPQAAHTTNPASPKPQAAQPIKSASPKPTLQTATPSTQSHSSWQDIFMQLKLTGAARMLAEQCSLVSQTDSKIELALNSKHKALLQDAMIKRITDSLNQYFQRSIQLSIKLAESTQETPADVQVRKAEHTQQQAEQAIYNDTKVQQIIKAFDAKIIKDSIKPVILNSGEDT
jgi:DNA polymerase-3 subunit gamma/tau